MDELLASFSACHKVWLQAMEARKTPVTTAFALITDRNFKEHQEAIEKEKATFVKENANVWQIITLEYIMNMKIVMGYFDELSPEYSFRMKRAVKEQLDSFLSTLLKA